MRLALSLWRITDGSECLDRIPTRCCTVQAASYLFPALTTAESGMRPFLKVTRITPPEVSP